MSREKGQPSLKLTQTSKILIIGTSGSGKSTLARKLALKLGVPDIELDALFWKENWQPSEPEEFRTKIKGALNQSQGFVIHGNYNKVRDLTWGNSQLVIWLDYPKSLVMYRVLKRSILRILKQETLWAGNKESIKKTFFSKDSILLWAWQTYALRKKQYEELARLPEYQNVTLLRFKSPREAEELHLR